MVNLRKSTIACSILIIFAASMYATPAVQAQTNGDALSVNCPFPVVTGQPVTCNAVVTDIGLTTITPTGTVDFSITGPGPVTFTTPNPCTLSPVSGSMGQSSCSVTFTLGSAGPYTVAAVYSGDSNHVGGTEASTLIVASNPTMTTVTCNPHTVAVNQLSQCTAAVTDTSSTPITPTGTVSFSSSSSGIFIPASNCTLGAGNMCSVNYRPNPGSEGTHVITGTYNGDPIHSTSSSYDVITVTRRTTTTSVSCSASKLTDHHSTPCTATVTDTSPGTPITPTGLVEWHSTATGTFTPSSCTLVGAGSTAACTVTFTAGPGKAIAEPIAATYHGDIDHSGSSGSTTIFTA